LTGTDKLKRNLTLEKDINDTEISSNVGGFTNAQDLTTIRTSGSLVNSLAILPNEAYNPMAKANPLNTPIWKREKHTKNSENVHPYA